MRILSAHIIAMTALGMALVLNQASAQSFPSKPVRIVLPVSPGGLQDAMTRAIAAELTRAWGQTALVENRPGATSVIAANYVAKSAPDGHTLFQTDSTTWHTNMLLRASRLPYNPSVDFTPVMSVARTNDVLVARPALGVSTIGELVALAKSKPGTLNYGSFGIGSGAHFAAEKFGVDAGIKAIHIPYKGGGEVLQALLGGQVDFAFTGVSSMLANIRQGRLRALAFGGDSRSPVLPDVPTLKESGYNFDTGGWFAWLAPAGTPRPVIDRIAADTARVLDNPAFRDKHIVGAGLAPYTLLTTPFTEVMKNTRAKFEALFKAVPIQVD